MKQKGEKMSDLTFTGVTPKMHEVLSEAHRLTKKMKDNQDEILEMATKRGELVSEAYENGLPQSTIGLYIGVHANTIYKMIHKVRKTIE